jgi:probable addiction module antidote protein
MSELAKASGLTREALYKALRPDAKPRYDTIAKVCGALGCGLWRRRFAYLTNRNV